MGNLATVTDLIPETVNIQRPDDNALSAQAQKFLEISEAIEIKNITELNVASAFLRENKNEQNRLNKERKEVVDPLNKVVKSINAKFKPVIDALKTAEVIIKRKIGTYQDETEKKRLIEEAAAEDKASKERAKLESRAERLRATGKTVQADAVELQAVTTVASIPAQQPAKVSGISTRKVWVAKVNDPMVVCRAIADGLLPASLIEFKKIELNRTAAMWKDNRTFPGLTITQENQVTSR